MVTQLVEHERIQTTKSKAKAIRPLAEKVIALGKKASKGDIPANRRLQGILTTKSTFDKAVMQIAPRFKLIYKYKF